MEDLIGFLIFLVIVAVSIVGKIKTDRNTAEKKRADGQRPVSPDDLPESTRKILFGSDDNIPMAKPREQSHSPERVPERKASPPPVPGRQVLYEQHPPAAQPQRPAPPVSRAPQVQQRQQSRSMEEHTQRRQQAAQQSRQPQRATQQPPTQRRPAAQQQRPVQPAATSRAARSKRPVPVPAAAAVKAPAPRAGGLLAALQSKEGLSQSVVLREILGPPRAFDL